MPPLLAEAHLQQYSNNKTNIIKIGKAVNKAEKFMIMFIAEDEGYQQKHYL